MTKETHGSSPVRVCMARTTLTLLGTHSKATRTWTPIMEVVVK